MSLIFPAVRCRCPTIRYVPLVCASTRAIPVRAGAAPESTPYLAPSSAALFRRSSSSSSRITRSWMRRACQARQAFLML
jgi:hypothetical protein